MTTPSLNPLRNKHRRHQRGAAMLILMLIVMLGLITLFTFRMDRKGPELNADRQTALALAQAKEALLGYAARDINRPGSLPCADINDDGDLTTGIDSTCTPDVVARLPWKLLGLPDLRDGNGERLWYAVSPKFRAFLTSTTNPLNSTVVGQITLRDTSGAIISDAANPSTGGVIAIIIAPGGVINRANASSPQDRSCAGGGGCTSASICQPPYQSVAKCNPINYLDLLSGVEDNANVQAGTQNGFITGTVRDVSDPSLIVVNDRMLVITKNDLFSVVKKRIFGEIRGNTTLTTNCSSIPSNTGLIGYAATHSTSQLVFPWAAMTVGGSSSPGLYTGYLPAANLKFAKRGGYCQWTVMQDNGWDGLITYEVSQAYAPGGSGSCGSTATSCLVVNGAPNAKVRVTIDGTDFGIW